MGLGKFRHIDTSELWLQQDSIKKKLKPGKVKGIEIPADMNTKGLNTDDIHRYTDVPRMEHRLGRVDLAPEVHNLTHNARCERYNSANISIAKCVKFNESNTP